MFRIKLSRIIGLLTVAAFIFILAGILLRSRQGFILMLKTEEVIRTESLRKKLLEQEDRLKGLYQRIGEKMDEANIGEYGIEGAKINVEVTDLLSQSRRCKQGLEDIRLELASLPRTMEGKASFQQAVENLHHKDRLIKETAISIMGELNRKEALPYLYEVLNDDEVGWLAADTIVKIVQAGQKTAGVIPAGELQDKYAGGNIFNNESKQYYR